MAKKKMRGVITHNNEQYKKCKRCKTMHRYSDINNKGLCLGCDESYYDAMRDAGDMNKAMPTIRQFVQDYRPA